MKKILLYRLFRLGSIPEKLLLLLKQEGIIVSDNGIDGCFIAQHVNGPKKKYRHQSEGFSGCLVITKEKVVCYTYRRRQINISVKDPKITKLYVKTLNEEKLYLSFKSTDFQDSWNGVIKFQFNTKKALQFHKALIEIGAQHGSEKRFSLFEQLSGVS